MFRNPAIEKRKPEINVHHALNLYWGQNTNMEEMSQKYPLDRISLLSIVQMLFSMSYPTKKQGTALSQQYCNSMGSCETGAECTPFFL